MPTDADEILDDVADGLAEELGRGVQPSTPEEWRRFVRDCWHTGNVCRRHNLELDHTTDAELIAEAAAGR